MLDLSQEKIVIASHNAGKVREISDLLKPYAAGFSSAAELNLDEPEETEDTFIGNALLKAHAAAKASNMVALADDSGLAVNALNGAPGIYSARWAGNPRDFNTAMLKVHEGIGDNPDRTASFICVLALAWPDGREEVFEGRVDGNLIWPPRGSKGFGYDPMFVANGMEQTFAEIEPEDKHAISHRADSFKKLLTKLSLYK